MENGPEAHYQAAMSSLSPFLAASLALLALPGPTNALLAASAALDGPLAALRRVPAAVAAYALSIGAITALLGSSAAEAPGWRAAISLAAALWLAWSAVVLWRAPAEGEPAGPAVSAARVFVTTLLNPKALVLSLLLPAAEPLAGILPHLAGLSALVLLTGAAWVGAGALVARCAGGGCRLLLSRGAALVLLGFTAFLVGSAASAGV